MQELSRLQEAAEQALRWVQAREGVREAEAFVAANDIFVARLGYSSHIPCEGVLEPKSAASFGVGLQVVFDGAEARIGSGQETGDLSEGAVRSAFEKARAGAVADPTFESLPRPTGEERTLEGYHDPALMEMADEDIVGLGWEAVEGALETFESGAAQLGRSADALAFILGGDVTIVQERIAVASSSMPRVQTDETTLVMAALTAMVEAEQAKGTGWCTGARRGDFSGAVGAEAAENAFAAVGGRKIESGKYRVVLGPQAVTDILTHVVLPSLDLGSIYASSSCYLGKLTQQVMDTQLSLYDHGALAGRMGSKGITCEGLPTGRTDLIRGGVMVGTLADHYDSRRILKDPEGREKLGVEPADYPQAFVPRNGFRFRTGGGRGHAGTPGTAPTNAVIESAEPMERDELLWAVGDGIYVGRIWYTYPVNGLNAGDFTCTVIADSHLIRGGRIVEPLLPNVVRMDDNVGRMFNSVIGVGGEHRGVIVWAADEVVYAPEIAIDGVPLTAIAGFLSGGG